MLRVTVELVPIGVESKKRIISQISIFNTTEKNEANEYKYIYEGCFFNNRNNTSAIIFEGEVCHNRLQNVWILLNKIITAIIPLDK